MDFLKNRFFAFFLAILLPGTFYAQNWKYIASVPGTDVQNQVLQDVDSAFISVLNKFNPDSGFVLQKIDLSAESRWRKAYKSGKNQFEVFRVKRGISGYYFLGGALNIYDSSLHTFIERDGFVLTLNDCFEPVKLHQFSCPGPNQIIDVFELNGQLLLIFSGLVQSSTTMIWFDPLNESIAKQSLSASYLHNTMHFDTVGGVFYSVGSAYRKFIPDTSIAHTRGFLLKFDTLLNPIWQALNDTSDPEAHESGQGLALRKDGKLIYLFSDRDFDKDNSDFGPHSLALVDTTSQRLRSGLIGDTKVKETARSVIQHSNGSLYSLSDFWPTEGLERGYGALYKVDDRLQVIKSVFINEGLVTENTKLRSFNEVLSETYQGHILVGGTVYNESSESMDPFIYLLDSNLNFVQISTTPHQYDLACLTPVIDSVYELPAPIFVQLNKDSFQLAQILTREFGVVGLANDFPNQKPVQLYPNPFSTTLNIQFQEEVMGLLLIELFDMQGKPIGYYELEGGNSIYSIQLSHLPNQAYILKLSVNNQLQRFCILKSLY